MKKADNPQKLVLSAQALIIIRYSGLSLSESSILFLKNDAVFIEYTDEHNIFVNVKTAYYLCGKSGHGINAIRTNIS